MKKFAIEIKYATLYTLSMVGWAILEKELGYHDEKISDFIFFGMLSGFLTIIWLFFGILEKKKSFYNNQMTFQQGMISGVVISFLMAVFSPLWQYIAFYIISPDLFGNLIANSVSRKVMTLENAQLYYSFRSYVLQAAFTSLSFGVIISALIALVLKSKKS